METFLGRTKEPLPGLLSTEKDHSQHTHTHTVMFHGMRTSVWSVPHFSTETQTFGLLYTAELYTGTCHLPTWITNPSM